MAEWYNTWQNGVADGSALTIANSDDNGAGDAIDDTSVTGSAGGAAILVDTGVSYPLGARTIECRNGTSGNASFRFGAALGVVAGANPFFSSYYWRVSALPLTTNTLRIGLFVVNANTFAGEWRLNSSGELQIYDRFGTPQGSPSSTVHSATTFYYVSAKCTRFHSTTGELVLLLRSTVDGSILETVTASNIDTNPSAGAPVAARAGNARTTANFTVWIGEARASDVDYPNLSLANLQAIQDAFHVQASDEVTLSSQVSLVVNDAAHDLATDNVALVYNSSLIVNDATHDLVTDSPTITQAHTLTVADSSHDNVSDSPTLTQTHFLSVNDSTMDNVADNVVLTQAHTLVVADSTQDQVSDSPTLTQAHTLVVADATQQNVADSPTLSIEAGEFDLTVAESIQDIVSDNITLTQQHNLIVADATHAQVTDAVTLTQAHTLVVSDATHLQISDVLTLSQIHQLIVAEAFHALPTERPTITVGEPITPPERIYTVAAEEPRLITVAAESRVSTVALEQRLTTVEAEERLYVIPSV